MNKLLILMTLALTGCVQSVDVPSKTIDNAIKTCSKNDGARYYRFISSGEGDDVTEIKVTCNDGAMFSISTKP